MFGDLLSRINKEVEKGATTFDELSSELRNDIGRDIPPEIVYKGEGKDRIENIKYFINLP